MHIFYCHEFNGVLNTRADIFNLEVRIIILNDFVEWNTLSDQFKYILHRNSRASNTGLAKMYVGIDLDSFSHYSPHFHLRYLRLFYTILALLSS